nr:zinc finger BED domain-containing protein RICESLEEPER 2-like [Tanacetum cinerariifolium]
MTRVIEQCCIFTKTLRMQPIRDLSCVTVDNASSNDGAIRRLHIMLKGPNAILDCKYLHLRCCAHIINLVVRDGLEEQNSSICKIRNAIKYLRSSSGRQESFENGVKFKKVDCKRKPCLDVDTRWNSTFLMLETTVKFEKVFDRLELTERDYMSYFYNEPEDGEEGTRMIPKTKKKKKNVVGVPIEDDYEPVNTSHNASLQKIYAFDLIQLLMFNRFFLEYLRIFYDVTNKISGKICKIVEDALKELYAHYKIKLGKQNDETFTVSSSSTHSKDDCSMKIDLDDGFSEYLETQYGWWNQNMMKFPIVSQVAKHVLAMPISTVASESAFSTGERVIDKHRSSRTPKTAEALICAQDWLRSWFSMARGRENVMAVSN